MNTVNPHMPSPERQAAASQVAAVFNSLHEYLNTLQHRTEAGEMLTTLQLQNGRARIDEAAMWVIKHVLQFGTPPKPEQPAAPTDDNAKEATT